MNLPFTAPSMRGFLNLLSTFECTRCVPLPISLFKLRARIVHCGERQAAGSRVPQPTCCWKPVPRAGSSGNLAMATLKLAMNTVCARILIFHFTLTLLILHLTLRAGRWHYWWNLTISTLPISRKLYIEAGTVHCVSAFSYSTLHIESW